MHRLICLLCEHSLRVEKGAKFPNICPKCNSSTEFKLREDPLVAEHMEQRQNDWDRAHDIFITEPEAETIRNKYALYGINGFCMSDVIERQKLRYENEELLTEVSKLLIRLEEYPIKTGGPGLKEELNLSIIYKQNRLNEIDTILSTKPKRILLDI